MGENIENTLRLVFRNALEIDVSIIDDELCYQDSENWDSISHMMLIDEIEKTFQIELSSDEVMELKSFKKAKEILKNHDL